MRPNDDELNNERAGAAQPLDTSANNTNTNESTDTMQTERLQLREGDKVHGPYAHGNQFRLHIRGADGKERRVSFATRDAAERAKALAGRALSSTTVDQAVTAYLKHLRDSGTIKEATRQTHWYRMRAFFRLGAKDGVLIDHSGGSLRSLTREKCQALYDQLREESAVDTHRGCLTLAKAFGAWCVKQGMIRENPLAGIEPRGERQRGKTQLRVDEARKLIATCCEEAEKGDESAVAVMTALLLGPRSTEVVSREVRDLDNDGWLLWITKSKTKAGERTLEIPAFLRPYLKRLAEDTKEPTDRLFGDHNRHWLLYHLHRLCKLAGVSEVCTHSLRGLHSTLAAEHGTTGHVVAKALGHTSFNTTRKHYVQPGTVERVAQGKVLGILDPTATKNRKRTRTSGKGAGNRNQFPVPKIEESPIA